MAATHLTEKAFGAYVSLLTRELRQAHLAYVLDDAVWGVGVDFDLLSDYGLSPDHPHHRQALMEAIAANLREGF